MDALQLAQGLLHGTVLLFGGRFLNGLFQFATALLELILRRDGRLHLEGEAGGLRKRRQRRRQRVRPIVFLCSLQVEHETRADVDRLLNLYVETAPLVCDVRRRLQSIRRRGPRPFDAKRQRTRKVARRTFFGLRRGHDERHVGRCLDHFLLMLRRKVHWILSFLDVVQAAYLISVLTNLTLLQSSGHE